MSTLYEITDNYLILQNMLENEVEDEQMLTDTLEAVDGELDIKMENYCKVIKNIEAQATALKNESDRLTNKRKVLENNINRLKSAMFETMKVTGKTKSGGDLFTVAIQKNGGKAPVILDIEPDELPIEYKIISERPNLEALRKALELEKDDSKCIAHLGEHGESLRIR